MEVSDSEITTFIDSLRPGPQGMSSAARLARLTSSSPDINAKSNGQNNNGDAPMTTKTTTTAKQEQVQEDAEVIGIEEWRRQLRERREELASASPVPLRPPPPSSSQPLTAHKSPLSPLSSSTLPHTTQAPIPSDTSLASEHVPALNHLSQTLGFTYTFAFAEPSAGRWTADLTIDAAALFPATNPQVLSSAPRSFSSKKAAREDLASQALAVLRNLPARDQVSSSSSSQGDVASTLPRPQQENFVGQLLEFCNAHPGLKGRYAEFTLAQPGPTRFSAEVLLVDETGMYDLFTEGDTVMAEEEGVAEEQQHQRVFGSREAGYASKRAARANAAREAVGWLRQKGRMQDPTAAADDGSDSRSEPSEGQDVASIYSANGNGGSLTSSNGLAKFASYAQQVSQLCVTLGLVQPRYEMRAVGDTVGFWDVAGMLPVGNAAAAGIVGVDPNANGSGSGGEGEGVVGGGSVNRGRVGVKGAEVVIAYVEGIFGKKAAKEECAKAMIEKLEAERAKRAASAARIIGMR